MNIKDVAGLPLLTIFIRDLFVDKSNNFIVGKKVITGTVVVGWAIFVKVTVCFILLSRLLLLSTRLGLFPTTGSIINNVIL